jgi:hypothetical protein
MPSTAERPYALTVPVKLLGILALATFGWSVYEGQALGRHSAPLQTSLAPRRIVSLALAPTAGDAQAILDEWQCGAREAATTGRTPCAVAREAIALDYRFISAYAAAWILIPIWALIAGRFSRQLIALVIAAVVFGALSDVAENSLLEGALWNATSLEPARLFRLTRLAAMTKFVMLLLGIAGGLVVGFGALRRLTVGRWQRELAHRAAARSGDVDATTSAAPAPMTSVKELMQRETYGISEVSNPGGPNTQEKLVCAVNAAADEQYVSFREADLVGLAFSGGGIKSATFNLGLLQGLHGLKLLPLVDYVSTVAGGGFIGLFWSTWLKRLRTSLLQSETTPGSSDWMALWNEQLFPTADSGPGRSYRVESDAERHLREFSGFLAPRGTDFVVLLATLPPTLIIGLSMIGTAVMAWLALTFPLASLEADAAPALTIAIVSGLVYWLLERMSQRLRRDTSGRSAHVNRYEAAVAARGTKMYGAFAVGTIVLIASLEFWIRAAYEAVPHGPWPIFTGLGGASHAAPDASGLVRWWALTGIDNPGRPSIFSPRLFDYGVVWLAAGLVLIAVRTTSAIQPRPWRRESLAAFDRVLMRTMAMGTAWIGLALLWHLSINLDGVVTVAISAAICGGVFAALRRWIGLALRRPWEASLFDRLKTMLPAPLAYLTLALTTVTIGGVLIETAEADWFAWWMASAVMTGVLVIGLFIAPDEFGMHAFYRDRIARVYGGATLEPDQGASDNRGTDPREGDDSRFTDLVSRPLHLVCCAAIDVAGSQGDALNRGARSGVFSRFGFSIGRYAREWHEYSATNRLGSAIAASAAAFNSNMGHKPVRMGPAASFLMTMLNLRFGLWVRHPLAKQFGVRAWPGLLYYRELLGLIVLSGRTSPEDVPRSAASDILLSDGGYVENLALYELVRRHCKYIIVSDCSADPAVAFDDLGNALRRIREDFGVDVDLDVEPLRPGSDGVSRQHIAVGTIKYSGTHPGILLYIKPSMTGDEPPDIQQYRARNAAFPHEVATDGFHDEAQWETYRRLGRHAAEHIFEFVRRDSMQTVTAKRVFDEAVQHWRPAPPANKTLHVSNANAVAIRGRELQTGDVQSEPLEWQVDVLMKKVPTSIYHLLSVDSNPLFTCKVRNGHQRRNVRLTALIAEFSVEAVESAWLEPGAAHTFRQLPAFSRGAIHTLSETARATLNVKIEDLSDQRVLAHNAFDVRLHPRTTVFLEVQDESTKKWNDLTSYIGAFVTPNNVQVQRFVRAAASAVQSGQFVGYQAGQAGVLSQVRGLFEAFKASGIAYRSFVESFDTEPGLTMQRVQLPRDTLASGLANCVDGQVLVASALEGIGLSAGLVYIQKVDAGHALVSWETQRGNGDWQYLDTTKIGESTFEENLANANSLAKAFERTAAQINNPRLFRRHALAQLRAAGISPME